jgi:iron(III) transport system substrate-binding protein
VKSKGPLLLIAALGVIVAAALALRSGGGATSGQMLTVYTAHAQTDIDAFLPLFEAKTGIKAQFVKMGSGEIIQRVRAERENPICDVIWSIAGEQLEANQELLEPYRPQDWDAIDPAFKVGDAWLPYTGILVVFVVNTQATSPSPKTWKDLGDPALKGKISSARADKSGSAYMQLATVLGIYKDEGWSVYDAALANFSLSGSSSAVTRFVNDGEAAVGITIEDNALRYVKAGGPVKIVYPEDGTSLAPDGVALVKRAPHAEQAKAFIDWALSKTTQDQLSRRLGRRPVRSDGETPEGLPALSEIKLVPYDFMGAAAKKTETVKRWTERVAQLRQR